MLLAAATRSALGGNPERQEEPDQEEDNLDPAEEGEASEEAHCASNETQLGLSCYL